MDGFRKQLLGTGLEDLGSGNCLEGLMMREENGKNKPSGRGQFPDFKKPGSLGLREQYQDWQGKGCQAGRNDMGSCWASQGNSNRHNNDKGVRENNQGQQDIQHLFLNNLQIK